MMEDIKKKTKVEYAMVEAEITKNTEEIRIFVSVCA